MGHDRASAGSSVEIGVGSVGADSTATSGSTVSPDSAESAIPTTSSDRLCSFYGCAATTSGWHRVMNNGTLRTRLRTWQLRLGLSRESNPTNGPSNEDIARERSFAQDRARNKHRSRCSPGDESL